MWKPIEIEDKEIINSYLTELETETSELNFTNLYIWQVGQDMRYREMDGFLVIRQGLKAHDYFFPIGSGDLTQLIHKLKEEHGPEPLVLRCLDESMKNRLEEAMPGAFQFTHTEDRDDYIFSVQELIDLPGRKYRNKRNFILGFERDYQFEYHRLTPETTQKVIHSQLEWCNRRNCEHFADLHREKIGIIRSLEQFEKLHYVGAYIEVNGKIEAFTFGEPITDDMVVIHIEKANDDFRGLYQFINQQFLKNEWSQYTYVNRECDLGIEGLRKAKQSYKPMRMVEKYRAVLQ